MPLFERSIRKLEAYARSLFRRRDSTTVVFSSLVRCTNTNAPARTLGSRGGRRTKNGFSIRERGFCDLWSPESSGSRHSSSARSGPRTAPHSLLLRLLRLLQHLSLRNRIQLLVFLDFFHTFAELLPSLFQFLISRFVGLTLCFVCGLQESTLPAARRGRACDERDVDCEVR